MTNMINFESLKNELNSLDTDCDYAVLNYIEAIEKYESILFSETPIEERLFAMFEISDMAKGIFLNTIYFKSFSEDYTLTNNETILVECIEKLRVTTDNYFDLLTTTMSVEMLNKKNEEYTQLIKALITKYQLLLKRIIKEEILIRTKKRV